MMNDPDFEDQAAIHVVAAILSSKDGGKGFFHANQTANPADYAELAYRYANALVQHRKKLANQRPKP